VHDATVDAQLQLPEHDDAVKPGQWATLTVTTTTAYGNAWYDADDEPLVDARNEPRYDDARLLPSSELGQSGQ
jgi:hypothetical protein